MGAVIDAPPTSIANSWWQAHTSTSNTASGSATSSALYFEWNPNDQAHDWIFAVAMPNLTPSGSSISSSQVKYAYDYQANAWWGLASGSNRPTITFYSGFSGDTILTNQFFIMWVVNNSDWRTRYEGEQWIDPTVAWDSTTHTFTWILDGNNVSSSLRIYKASTQASMPGQQVYSEIPSTTIGAWAPTDAGFYTLVWTYSVAGVQDTYTWEYTSMVGPPESVGATEFDHFTFHGDQLTTYWTNASPVSAILQMMEGSSWINVSTQQAFQIGNYWTVSFDVEVQGTYRVVAQPSAVIGTIGELIPTGSDYNFAEMIQNVAKWVGDFVDSVGSLFSWLPNELTSFLISVFSVMVLLGLIGWLKG